MDDLKCPSCGSGIIVHPQKSMPPQYVGECSDKCGFELGFSHRKDRFKSISQYELDAFYLGHRHGLALGTEHMAEVTSKLNDAKSALREYSRLFGKALRDMKSLRTAVSMLNDARHDGPPDKIFEAYNEAFIAIATSGNTMSELEAVLKMEEKDTN